MKTSRQQRKKSGFFSTAAEVIVGTVIVGILLLIALPSFVCAHKDPEAQHYVGRLVREQQTHFIEEGHFASNSKFNNFVPKNWRLIGFPTTPP
jgi:Tfp pilus assembly protein PilE